MISGFFAFFKTENGNISGNRAGLVCWCLRMSGGLFFFLNQGVSFGLKKSQDHSRPERCRKPRSRPRAVL